MSLRHGIFVSGPSGGVTSPQDARLALSGLLSGPGVLRGGAVTGSSSGPNMKYTVASGVFVTARGTVANDGVYVVPNVGALTVDSGAPAPSSGSRYDVIYIRQKNAFDGGFGDANSDPEIAVVVGSASSTPSVPAAPAGALVLAQALVDSGDASGAATTITAVAARSYVGSAPAYLGLSNTSTMGTWTNANQAYPVTDYDNLDADIGDLSYDSGVITVHVAGIYRWDATVQLPAATVAYRVRTYLTVNGTRDGRGETSTNFSAGTGAQYTSFGFQRWFDVGDQMQVAGECSTNGLANVQPVAFSAVRLFAS